MKEALKLVLYQVIYYLVNCVPAKERRKHLMLVKTDEIGDYILIRNLLGYFKKSEAYKDHKITFVGNSIFKEIFDAYDASIADDSIWIHKKKFRINLFYRFNILRKIRKAGSSDVINLIYSRSFRVDDMAVAVTTAKNKIAMSNNGRHLSKTEKGFTPAGIYNQLLNVGEENLFDAYRNARFIENVLKTNINSVSTIIGGKENAFPFSLPDSYFVVFPGSGIRIKKWSAENFASVAKHVKEKYGFTPVVCGSEADRVECKQFIDQFDLPSIDLTGKTNLIDFLNVLRHAKCLISVDTGAVHLAAAVRCPVFGLFSGLHYGRFAPYPKEIARNFFAIYPDRIERILQEKPSSDMLNIPMDLINEIPSQKVIASIDGFMSWGGKETHPGEAGDLQQN